MRTSLDTRSASRWEPPLRGLPDAVAWAILGVLLVAAAAGLFHLTRGTTFWFDEWNWITGRRGNDPGTFLRSYNEHFSLIPIAMYRALFATAGLTHYGAYRTVVIVAHLGCTTLVFTYAKRRVGNYLGLLAAALMLLLGPGWQDFIWPFQVAWLISLAAGLGALLMLDRGDRRGDLIACALVAVSLASSGIGLIVAGGVLVDVVWGRRRWGDAWIVAVPIAVYAVWWVVYQHTGGLSPLHLVPKFVANEAAATVGALVGASAPRPIEGPFVSGHLLSWGRPLAVIAVLLVVWRLVRLRSIPSRVVTLMAMLGAFWVLTALTRAAQLRGTQAWASRYLYVGVLLLLLLAVELLRAISIPRYAKAAIGIGVVAAMVSNFATLRNAAFDLRVYGERSRADLGALELGRALEKPDFVPTYLEGYPLVHITAGEYYSATKALGSPAASLPEILALPETAREAADGELIRIHAVSLAPASRSSLGSRPALDRGAGGTATARGSCTVFRRGAGSRAGWVELAVPASGLLITPQGGTAEVGLRRFAGAFTTIAVVGPTPSRLLKISPDPAPQPWHLRVAPASGVTVCGLR